MWHNLALGCTLSLRPKSLPFPLHFHGARVVWRALLNLTGCGMKARLLIILGAALVVAASLGAQTDNTLYVKQFPGLTVGAKLSAAMAACNPNTAVPCILVLDPSLAAFPAGSFSPLCSQCSIQDYRAGSLSSAIVDATALPGNGTISAVLANNPTGNVRIRLACGSYYDNLRFAAVSNVVIQGAGTNCTNLYPLSSAPGYMVSIDNTNGAMQYISLRDLTMTNQSGFTLTDGILITGSQNNINDWHYFQNLIINGFRNNLNITGRTIWTTFDNVHFASALNNGVNAATSAVVNHIAFRDGQVNNSANYGVYWANSNSQVSQSIDFDHFNVEANGQSGTLANCAGLYMNGVGAGSVTNSYFEANCTTVPDGTGADVRLDGTYAQAFDIRSNLLWSTTNYSILNTTTETTGTYEGNRFGGAVNIKTVTQHVLSKIVVGANMLSGPLTYVLDGSG